MTSTLEKVRSKIGAASVAALLAGIFAPRTAAAASFLGVGPMHLARDSHTATLLLNGKVLVAGGSDGTNALSSAELYDLSTGTWSVTGALRSKRRADTATLLPNGQVLVWGGASGTDPFDGILASMELYDPATGLWNLTQTGDPRTDHTATLLRNGKVLIAGGVDSATTLGSVELYDPATRKWTLTGNLNVARY